MLTWHLVLGRERDFALLISNMYIAPVHGHTTTWYKFWHHFKTFIISIILYQLQKDPFCLIILWYFVLFHTCTYSPRARGDNPWGQFFYGSRKVFSLWLLIACFKKYLCSLILCIFHDCIHVYSPGRGRQPTSKKNLMSTGRPHHFSHLLQVSKKSLQPLILYTSFHDLINVYSCGSGADNIQGTKFWCQQKPLVTSVMLHIYFMLLYMYMYLALGQTTPWGQNFDVNRNILSLRSFFVSFLH